MHYDDLLAQHDEINDAANAAADAAQQLARLANGNRAGTMPAPTAYTVLGNLKVLLAHLNEVIDFLPRGLSSSLHEESIQITDSAPSGEPREPDASVSIATDALRVVYEALQRAGTYAELGQQAITGQGYEPSTGAA